MNIQNLIRGGVAMGVGYLVALLAHLGFHVGPDVQLAIIGVIASVVGTFYLHLVAELEKVWPWTGWLLGAKAPKTTAVTRATTTTAKA